MYTDLLTKIKNAQAAKKESVKIPFSNLDLAIAELLVKYGFLDEAAKKGRMPKRIIEIKLKYLDGQGVIKGIKFLSKPSRQLYAGYKELNSKIKQGYGIEVISSPKGTMTTKEAKKQKVGGARLFEIW